MRASVEARSPRSVSTKQPWPILRRPSGAGASGGAGARAALRLTTVVGSVTVAAGVFAPGHLGELTRQTRGSTRCWSRPAPPSGPAADAAVPSRGVFRFVWPFPGLVRGKAWTESAGLGPGLRVSVSGQGITELRRRIGAAPDAPCSKCRGRVAQPSTRACGSAVGPSRCVSHEAARHRPQPVLAGQAEGLARVTGYPVVRLMTLVETGTRALLGAVFGPPSTGEIDYARALSPLLNKDMLVLTDRGFDAAKPFSPTWPAPAPSSCIRSTRKLSVLTRLRDGSHLSRIGDDRADHHRRHHRHLRRRHPLHRELSAGHHPARHPARQDRALPRTLEHEIAYLALRHTLGEGRARAPPTWGSPNRCGRC